MKTIFTLALLALGTFSQNVWAGCDCSKIEGLWLSTDREAKRGTFIHIPKNCQGVGFQVVPEPKEPEGLIPDRMLCDSKTGAYQLQMRFPEGYVDNEGTPAVYPLPALVAEKLRADLIQIDSEHIRFCLFQSPCESAVFERIPKSEILEE